MSELWDLVDINGRKTGVLHERERVDFIPEGLSGNCKKHKNMV